MSDNDAFDPIKHLVKVGRADYLPVAARVMWFREDYPSGTIETDAIELTDQRAIFRATIRKISRDGVVEGSATGYGSETPKDFGDFLEKAETKAIGRALGALGYGTAAALDDEGERIVDAPVERRTLRHDAGPTQAPNVAPRPAQQATTPSSDRTPGGASVKSLNLSLVLAEELGMSDDDVHRWTAEQFGKTSRKDLDQRQMSTLIDWLKSLQAAGAAKPAQPAQPAQMTALSGDIDESGEIVDWTRFWVIARADGYSSPADIRKRAGFDIAGMTPQQAVTALKNVAAQPS